MCKAEILLLSVRDWLVIYRFVHVLSRSLGGRPWAECWFLITPSLCDAPFRLISVCLTPSLAHVNTQTGTGVANEEELGFTVLLIGSLEWERQAGWLSALRQTLSLFLLFIEIQHVAKSKRESLMKGLFAVETLEFLFFRFFFFELSKQNLVLQQCRLCHCFFSLEF